MSLSCVDISQLLKGLEHIIFIPTGSLIESWLWIAFFFFSCFNWMPELKRTQRLASGHSQATIFKCFFFKKQKKSAEQVCLKHSSSVVETSSNTRIRPSISSPVFGTRDLRHEPRVNKLSATEPLIQESDPTRFEWSAAAAFCSLGLVQSDFNDSANLIFSFLLKQNHLNENLDSFPFGSFSVVKTVILEYLKCSGQ